MIDLSKYPTLQRARANGLYGTGEGLSAEQSAFDRELEEMRREAVTWSEDDTPLPEDAAIHAAHPLRRGNHDTYAQAMRLVGAKRSKGALVDLVNWLLAERNGLQCELVDALKFKLAAAEILDRG